MVRLAALSIILLGAAGCIKSEPTAVVHGKVTWDEEPLVEGEIYFILPGKPPEILPVRNGTFDGKAKVGRRRVEVYAYRLEATPLVSRDAFGASGTVKVNYIPARYNSESILEASIAPPGPNRFKFDLKSK